MIKARDGVIVVDCVEYGRIDVDARFWLTEGHTTKFSSEIEGRDILRASFKNGIVSLQATSYVGVIPINDHIIVRVKPRVPIANLARMVTETGHNVLPLDALLREYAGSGTTDDWTMDIYTDALLEHVDTILDAGLLRAYERREAEGHFPHGRIDFNRTLHRFAARGADNKAAYSWFERTVDTPANRCIRAAMEANHDRLSRNRSTPRRGQRSTLARLAGQLHAFDDVSVDPDYRFLDDAEVLGLRALPDSRAYYRAALDVSVLILQKRGIALDLDGDDVLLKTLLIDTNELFEKFVRSCLTRLAKEQEWPVAVLDGNTEGKVDLYDVPHDLPALSGVTMQADASRDRGKAQPDVVLRAPDGSSSLIAEIKNTVAVDGVLPDRSHVEQAITYALRYGLPFTLLIHPWSKGRKGLIYIGRIRTIDVYDYRLDLSSYEGIDDAITDMATAVASLAGIATGHEPTSG